MGLLHTLDSLEQGGYVSAMLDAGYLDVANKRYLPNSATAKGDSEDQLYYVSAENDYRRRKDDRRVEPWTGLLATCMERKGFREKYSELVPDADRVARDATFATLKLNATCGLRVVDWSLEPELSLGYERALRVPASRIEASLQGVDLKQASAHRGRDLFNAGMVLHARRGPLQGSLELQGMKGERVGGSIVSLRLSYGLQRWLLEHLDWSHRGVVVSLAHAGLPRYSAQGILAAAIVERRIGKTIEQLLGTVPVEDVDHQRVVAGITAFDLLYLEAPLGTAEQPTAIFFLRVSWAKHRHGRHRVIGQQRQSTVVTVV